MINDILGVMAGMTVLVTLIVLTVIIAKIILLILIIKFLLKVFGYEKVSKPTEILLVTKTPIGVYFCELLILCAVFGLASLYFGA